MKSSVVVKVTGLLLVLSSLTLLIPIALSLYFDDQELVDLAVAFVGLALIGALLLVISRGEVPDLKRGHAFLIVVVTWVFLSAFNAVPLYLAVDGIGVPGALFEAVSGLTTTGATVLSSIDTLPPSIQFLRQEMQWIGGIGIVVLAIAVAPVLGVGGMNLLRAELPGPTKDDKIMPRLAQSTRALLWAYLLVTLICAGAYYLAGMSVFDAICHSMATVSTGGFSTHDASIGYFNSLAVELICIFFMLFSSISFSQHFGVLLAGRWKTYIKSDETRFFLIAMLVSIVVSWLALLWWVPGFTGWTALRYGMFSVVSQVTSTGFGVTDMSAWPAFVPTLLLLLTLMGGCTGSTAGGIKILRIDIALKAVLNQVRQLIHPSGVFTVKHDGRPVEVAVISSIWAYLSLYFLSFHVLNLSFIGLGMTPETAFGAVLTTLNNVGPGLGDVANSFAGASDAQKLLASASMLLGRLEFFPIVVLLTAVYWREV